MEELLALSEGVVARLRQMANSQNVAGMAKFGMNPEGRLGISIPQLRKLAKELGRNHRLALHLWESGLAEARILASMVADPKALTGTQMEAWVSDFNSWDLCDQCCLNLFEQSPHAIEKLKLWCVSEQEFVKRAGFALLACLAWHDKKADDALFKDLLPLIEAGALDARNFVKKAVNWALRTIGKRSRFLNLMALETAQKLLEKKEKTASWIARDAIRELENEKVRARLKR